MLSAVPTTRATSLRRDAWMPKRDPGRIHRFDVSHLTIGAPSAAGLCVESIIREFGLGSRPHWSSDYLEKPNHTWASTLEPTYTHATHPVL